MFAPLIILSPPRSFSSVVSTIIGQHPQLYGFPELHLFSVDTVDEMVKKKAESGKVAPPGVIRTLAQEHDGVQTTKTALKAIDWLLERRHWTTQELFNYLLELVNPRIGVEKSPQTTKKVKFIEKSYEWFPDAYYLHLTRHPVSSRKSIKEFFEHKESKQYYQDDLYKRSQSLDGLLVWYSMHRNILRFTNSLPSGQTMRIKGEDVLSDPDIYLPQLADWLGLDTGAEAIEAMKHPEQSPYAYTGPAPVPGGNDPKFMRNPTLRVGKVKEPSLEHFFETKNWSYASETVKDLLEDDSFEVPPEEDLMGDITQLANLMGYQ